MGALTPDRTAPNPNRTSYIYSYSTNRIESPESMST